ncbi:hypothetical protein D3C71_1183180 [compost metagenome]
MLTQRRTLQQVARRIRQQAETVDQLHFQLFQLGVVFRAGDAFVERQARVDVWDIVIWQQGRHAQLHLGLVAGKIFQRRFAPVFECIHRAFQQFHVQRKADGGHLAALIFTQQFARAADLQIVGSQGKTGAQVFQRRDGLQPLMRVGAHGFRIWRQQISIGLMVRTSDTTA